METKAKQQPYLTTFKVCNKVPEKIKIPSCDAPEHPAQKLRAYKQNHCIRVLQGSNFSEGKTIPKANGFVKTVIECYNSHHNLVIRPDDVWLAIMTQFSFYINKNAEKYRKRFVNFEGKKQLSVSVPGVLDSAPYDLCVQLMSDEIHKNLVDGKVKDWILPNFSTTTKDDLVTYGVIFMAAVKKYFDYKFCLCCGIPNITLDGTLEDWQEIGVRLLKLKEYELDTWVGLLEPIIQNFIQAKAGKPDLDFWNRICDNRGGGSGPTYLSGWITAFCHFNVEGNPIGSQEINNWGDVETDNAPWLYLDMQDIPCGVVEVDVTIDDNGTEYKSVLFAGHMASVLEDEVTLKPRSGWAMVLKHPLPGEPEPKPVDQFE